MIRDQLIQSEVRKPYQAKINMLEAPFQPQFPIGPNYARDSAIAALIALLIALASVATFALINRQSRPDTVLSPYPVFTPLQSDPHQQQEHLADQSAPQISYQQARELTTEDCQQLLKNASLHCKLALTLMLNGVNIDELSRLVAADFDAGILTISGQYQRRLYLAKLTAKTLNRVTTDLSPESSMWMTPTGETLELAELELMLKHAADNAGLNDSEPVSFKDIRHTYLLFLARQGASLNDIEQVAGYLCALEMEHCQQMSATAQLTDVSEILTQHPALG